MKRGMILLPILLVFFQIVFVSVHHRVFNQDMREEVQALGQKLEAEGMPPEQIRVITSKLSLIRGDVSSYVNGVATTIIMANGLAIFFLYGLIMKFNRRASS